VWVASKGDNAVTRIDPATGAPTRIPVGARPTAVAVGAGAVWVANSGDGTISRIDPSRKAVVKTLRIGSSPAGVTVWRGLVWVSAETP
jgi:YVTN family beta-propeller protein